MIHSYQQNDLLLFGHQTERLILEQVSEESHFAQWLEFCAFPGSLDYIGLHEHATPEAKCKAWFDRVTYRYTNGLGGMNALIEQSSGKLVGQCGLLVQDLEDGRFLEIGYSLHPAFRGKGYALEAARACMERAQAIKVSDEVISMIHVDNEPSMNVARSMGMEPWKEVIQKGDPIVLFRKML